MDKQRELEDEITMLREKQLELPTDRVEKLIESKKELLLQLLENK